SVIHSLLHDLLSCFLTVTHSYALYLSFDSPSRRRQSNMRYPFTTVAASSLLLLGAHSAAAALVEGVDVAGNIAQATWNLAKSQSFSVAIPRGIFEACGVCI